MYMYHRHTHDCPLSLAVIKPTSEASNSTQSYIPYSSLLARGDHCVGYCTTYSAQSFILYSSLLVRGDHCVWYCTTYSAQSFIPYSSILARGDHCV